ncbi:MAG: AAA family ATPase [Microbacterium sp.]|nr:AAA family ATPase [Microbacterium sp.]
MFRLTPDRPDDLHHDPDENGVLADTGSLDTAGIGLLGARTAQVSVPLSIPDEDDLADDDDVVGDEVSLDSLAAAPEIGRASADDEVEEIDDADVVLEIDDDDPGMDEATSGSESWVDADVEPLATPAAAGQSVTGDVVGAAAPAGWPRLDGEPSPTGLTAGDAPDVSADPVVEEPGMDNTPAGTPASGDSGPQPATRREAHLTGPLDRVHEVERVHTQRPEVALTSKRLDEFEAGRESPDLLTADRLLDHGRVGSPEPEGAWQHFVFSLSGGRINLGDGRRARARKELDRRIVAALPGGARFVPVLSRKGGVGKTTVTTLLGMALADARDDRVIAIDANPDRGTLAERIARPSGKTVRDLVRTREEVAGYNDISTIVARDETRLDVLASDADPRVSEAFSDLDYQDVASLAAHYYSIVLTDTGTGIVHSVMGATLDIADELVIVAGLSVDEARLASETLTWLETNGYAEAVRNAVVVLNTSRPGAPLVRQDELEAHFRTRVRAVVRMPYDPLIGTGSAITFRDLQPATRAAARELAATVVEGLRTLAAAA